MAEETTEIQSPYIGEEIVSWTVDEYPSHARGPVWYAVAFLIGLSLVMYAIVTRNFLFAMIIIMAGVIAALSALRLPERIPFVVTTRGVALGRQFVPYKELKSFSIVYEPPQLKNLYVDFRSSLSPHLVVPLEEQDPLEVRKMLLGFLTENQARDEESLSELLGRLLKL